MLLCKKMKSVHLTFGKKVKKERASQSIYVGNHNKQMEKGE